MIDVANSVWEWAIVNFFPFNFGSIWVQVCYLESFPQPEEWLTIINRVRIWQRDINDWSGWFWFHSSKTQLNSGSAIPKPPSFTYSSSD